MNKILCSKFMLNKDKKWYEFWKQTYIEKQYYLIVDNDFVVIGEEKELK